MKQIGTVVAERPDVFFRHALIAIVLHEDGMQLVEDCLGIFRLCESAY